MQFGILGSGSWGTAIAKILNDNGKTTYWYNRSKEAIEHIKRRGHNPQYLSSASFNTDKLILTNSAIDLIENCDVIIIAVPSAYTEEMLNQLPKTCFANKKIISAIKGILPNSNLLLNDYLVKDFNFDNKNYFALLGPCHAEEVAAEKLSYLTISGQDIDFCNVLKNDFKTEYINTIANNDIYGVQYASILKNIYALGAGIAHGLDYGDNFLSVFIANAANEMAGFLRKVGVKNLEVGSIDHFNLKDIDDKKTNYAASVYLGDLLVTCYSLHSRNRSFGSLIGRGYSVTAAQVSMNMVAEGFNASKCMFLINKNIKSEMPIAENIYKILWQNISPKEGFELIEKVLI